MIEHNTGKTDFRRISFSTRFGLFHLFWRETDEGPRVNRIVLPGLDIPDAFKRAGTGASPDMSALAGHIRLFCDGRPVVFDLKVILLDTCPEFQKQVLLAEYSVPRGRVTTYGNIAVKLGKPGAARAVGQALARNPFPIVIPCHRAVQSSGSLGGYQGGTAMKRQLLVAEGIEFAGNGRVVGSAYTW